MCVVEWGRIGMVAGKNGKGGQGVRKGRGRRVGQRKVGVLLTKKERVGRIVLGREEAKGRGRVTKGMGRLYG
jgi:hypothetical protein